MPRLLLLSALACALAGCAGMERRGAGHTPPPEAIGAALAADPMPAESDSELAAEPVSEATAPPEEPPELLWLGPFDYALAIFPELEKSPLASNALPRLFTTAPDGFGIYTYVLFAGDSLEPRFWRPEERELLRVIETYVVAQGERPTAGRQHVFLLPVYAAGDVLSLEERAGPELTLGARETLARYFAGLGIEQLASRLTTGSGPFLVSRAEPGLVPTTPSAPLLLADLGDVGAEAMYWIVDAYDRPVLGTGAMAIGALRERLAVVAPAARDPRPWLFAFGEGRLLAYNGAGADSRSSGLLD